MSTRQTLPHGYAVVQLADKQWYPLQVTRYYSGHYPDGDIRVSLFDEFNENRELVQVHYPRRDDALRHVQQQLMSEELYEQLKWQGVTIESDVYPERCAHYVALSEEITGHVPQVQRWSREVNVHIGASCSCGMTHFSYWDYSQVTIEDALQRAAEYVYEHRCPCTATTAHEYEQRLTA